MSKTRVKILATPKAKQNIPQINPFSVPSEMEYGGARPNMGHLNNDSRYPLNRYVDTSWNWGNGANSGQGTNSSAPTSKTLPESDNPDVVVEKQEKILGDFNGDGMPVLMGVNAGTHKSGNDQGIDVPDNSFVFSDTKNLTIKDPDILKQFGGTKPSTPAKLATKYDLVKYKAVIDNPKADELDKKTAQFNYTNAVQKLNGLASAQENMKANKGIFSSIPPMQQSQPGMQYGGFRFDENADPSTTSYQQWLMENKSNSVAMATNPVWPGLPNAGRFDDGINGYRTDLAGSLDEKALPGSYDKNPKFNFVDRNPDENATLPTDGYSNQLPYAGGTSNLPFEQQTNNKLQASRSNPFAQGIGADVLGAINNPDTQRNLQWALRASSYPQYSPTRLTAKGEIPQPVFLDPTRAKAAISEQANQAAYIASQSGNGPISRANALAYSGKAGELAANIEGEYGNKNAEIANRANQIAADIRNRTWEQQNMYNKQYSEETAQQLKDRYGFNTAMSNEFLKGMYEDRARSVAAHNYNLINPYFTQDQQGYIHPKSAEMYKAYQDIGKNNGQMSSSDFDSKLAYAKTLKDKYLAAGWSSEYAEKEAARHAGLREYESMSYDSNDPYKKKVRESGIPVQQYGGTTKKNKVKILSTP